MIGSRFGTIAVLKLNQLKKDRSRSGTPGAETAATQVSTKFGQFLPIFAKNSKFFQKFFIIFTHFSNENLKSFYLQRPQPHPSARADSSRGDKNQRIPPRQSSVKKRMARQQSDELEKTKRELPVSTGQFPKTSTFARATQTHSRDSGPMVH